MELVKNTRLNNIFFNKKVIIGILVTLIIVVAFIPLLTENTIYNHITGYDQPRSDFRDYTAEIQSWIDGEPVQVNGYLSRVIIGYPIMLLNQLTNISLDRIYITFCFLALIASGFTVYLVVKKITDERSAWIAIVLAFMCSTGVLAMFNFGMISNVINMYIILPVCVYSIVKWLDTKKFVYIVIGTITMSVFSLFHTTALYIPYVIATVLVIYSILILAKKKVPTHMPLITLILFITNVVVSFTSLPSATGLNEMAFGNAESIVSGGETTQIYHSAIPILQFITEYLSIPTLGVLLIAGVVWFKNRKTLIITNTTKYLLVILVGFIITLSAGAFLGISPEPVRTATDLATLMAIGIAVLLGLGLNNNKSIYIRALCYPLIAVGVIGNLIHWVV